MRDNLGPLLLIGIVVSLLLYGHYSAGDFDVKCRDAGGVTVGRHPAQSCLERGNLISIK
jgi:hypothetical protein